MNDQSKVASEVQASKSPWNQKSLWLLSLAVLLLLLGIIYALVHISSANSEMYPTSSEFVMHYHWTC